VNPLARVRVDEVKEFRLGQFRPVEANEREKRSTTRAEAEYKIALLRHRYPRDYKSCQLPSAASLYNWILHLSLH